MNKQFELLELDSESVYVDLIIIFILSPISNVYKDMSSVDL